MLIIPDDYSPEKQYPIIYLLHAFLGNEREWIEQSNASKVIETLQNEKRIPKAIYAFPDGKSTWYVDVVEKMESALMKEFIPFIEKTYSIDPSKRFIGGFSMGGFGALRLFVKHPDLFRGLMAMSPALISPGFIPKKIIGLLKTSLNDQEEVGKIYLETNLGKNKKVVKKSLLSIFKAINYYPDLKKYLKKSAQDHYIFISAGDEEVLFLADFYKSFPKYSFLSSIYDLYLTMADLRPEKERKRWVDLRIYSGSHNFSTAEKSLGEALEFVLNETRLVQKNVLDIINDALYSNQQRGQEFFDNIYR